MFTPFKLLSLTTALPLIPLYSSPVLAQTDVLTLINNALTEIAGDSSSSATTVLTSLNTTIGTLDAVLSTILPTGPIDTQSEINTILTEVQTDITDANQLFATYAGLFQSIVSIAAPTSITDALQQASTYFGTLTNGVALTNIASAILNGVSAQDLTQNVLDGYIGGINSYNNVNPAPPQPIYPQKSSQDAVYSVPEANLRAAIYIPPGYEYGLGSKQPVLLVPGTGAFGGVTFVSNFGKLLPQTGIADIVYLNVPGALLNDTQINSEYIAYAMNYVYAISNNKAIAVIPWSQGNPDTQWAFQYWPSTRGIVTDLISISADIHGTVNAYVLCPGFPNVPCPPAIIQQEYDANYITTLRNGGGSSAYVPTTSIYSITDEIVQPQSDPNASAFYNDVCNVGVTNNELQTICPNLPAGGVYTHEGVLYNPIAYALAIDALTHDGPGRIDRLNLDVLCNELVTDGLSLADVLATEGLIPLALVNIFLYPEKVLTEPPIMQYALNAPSRTCSTTSSTTTTTSSSTTVQTSTTTATVSTSSALTTTTTSSGLTSTTSASTATSTSTSASTSIPTSLTTSTIGTTTGTGTGTSSSTTSSVNFSSVPPSPIFTSSYSTPAFSPSFTTSPTSTNGAPTSTSVTTSTATNINTASTSSLTWSGQPSASWSGQPSLSWSGQPSSSWSAQPSSWSAYHNSDDATITLTTTKTHVFCPCETTSTSTSATSTW